MPKRARVVSVGSPVHTDPIRAEDKLRSAPNPYRYRYRYRCERARMLYLTHGFLLGRHLRGYMHMLRLDVVPEQPNQSSSEGVARNYACIDALRLYTKIPYRPLYNRTRSSHHADPPTTLADQSKVIFFAFPATGSL